MQEIVDLVRDVPISIFSCPDDREVSHESQQTLVEVELPYINVIQQGSNDSVRL